jgi:Fe2+ or Zn2+ uptake regulation protein
MRRGGRKRPGEKLGLQRDTRQRRAVLEVLQSLTSHPTATELHRLVRRRLPRISLGTVYRNLEALTKAGRARKLESGHREARFDGNCSGHYHVRCLECGRVADVHGASAEVRPEQVARSTGYRILGHRLEFVGICPGCRERESDSRAGKPGFGPGGAAGQAAERSESDEAAS